ncbi:hypothetical protein JZO80_10680 [Vagococcus fluvialis]|uniref:hypothetical protein n=1 Tax=Vagococcus fluvialis TaxID=2738 RepID=UPI000A342F0F|nr:hypothetical protein [Vagococcus fluvialis]MBO0420624.1 hypothetical protein [Vagococcus fluvialis]OTP33482.1 hypothetical protein A5798_000213 [Enterococcus sp. 6C8_DIV0013]
MIFCLGDDLLKELAETEEFLDYDSFLSRMLISLIESENNCLLTESSEILRLYRSIIDNKKVSNDMKKVIGYCFSNFTVMFWLTKKVNEKVIISKRLEKLSDIYVTPDYLMNNKLKLDNRVSLLSEDLTDCEFYEDISKKIIGISGTKILFRHVAGAGYNIYKEIKKSVIHNNDFVYAICDSDKYYPECEKGDTAKFLENGIQELADNGFIHVNHEVLKVSEKENLIKPSEYKKFNRNINLLNIYVRIEKNQDMLEYLTYLDFKSGLKKGIYSESSGYYDNLLVTYNNFEKELDQLGNKEAILNGLGRVCMDGFTSEHLEIGNTPLDDYRKEIAQNILSWGISIPERKII